MPIDNEIRILLAKLEEIRTNGDLVLLEKNRKDLLKVTEEILRDSFSIRTITREMEVLVDLLEYLGEYEFGANVLKKLMNYQRDYHPGSDNILPPAGITKKYIPEYEKMARDLQTKLNSLHFKQSHKDDFSLCGAHPLNPLKFDNICPDSKKVLVTPLAEARSWEHYNEPEYFEKWARTNDAAEENCFAIKSLYISPESSYRTELFSGERWCIKFGLVNFNFKIWNLRIELEPCEFLKLETCRVYSKFEEKNKNENNFDYFLDIELNKKDEEVAVRFMHTTNKHPLVDYDRIFIEFSFIVEMNELVSKDIKFQHFLKINYVDKADIEWHDTGAGIEIKIYPVRTKLYQLLSEYMKKYTSPPSPLPLSRIQNDFKQENLELEEGFVKDLLKEMIDKRIIETESDYKSTDEIVISKIDQSRIVEEEKISSQDHSEYVIINGDKVEVQNNELDLQQRDIKDISDIKGLDNLVNLKKLSLWLNQITEIKGLDSLKNLQDLNLGSNEVSKIQGLENLSNLKELDLSNQHPKLIKIDGLETLTSLQKLDLASNQIIELKGLEKLTNLEELNLNNNQIVEMTIVENFTELISLDLSYNEITELEGIKHLIKLKELKLFKNQIKEIKDIDSLENLQMLDLRLNPLMKNEEQYKKLLKNDELLEVIKLSKAKKVAKDILFFEYTNQRNATPRDFILDLKSLNIKLHEAEYYINFLSSQIDYTTDETSLLESKITEKGLTSSELSLYDLIVVYDFDFYMAKKLGKYLMDYKVINQFPRFPKKTGPSPPTSLGASIDHTAIEVIIEETESSAVGSLKYLIKMKDPDNGIVEIDDNEVENKLKSSWTFFEPIRAYKGDGPYIFLSYARDDQGKAYPIIKNLQLLNIPVWFDEGIPYDVDYPNFIANQIENCDLFLVLLSPNAIQRKGTGSEEPTGVEREIGIAKDIDQKRILVYLEPTKIPPAWDWKYNISKYTNAILKYNTRREEFYRKLLNLITEIIAED